MAEERPELLTTHDLKGRGWTASLIRDFLGHHDATRPNLMRFGRRKRLPPVKLYQIERVDEAERDERFLIAQGRAMEARERAERAKATIRRRIERQIDDFVWEWTPRLIPWALRKGATNKAYKTHEDELKAAIERGTEQLPHLSAKDRKLLAQRLTEKYRDALREVYPWFE